MVSEPRGQPLIYVLPPTVAGEMEGIATTLSLHRLHEGF